MPNYHWQAGSGRPIALTLTFEEAQSCAHPGDCEADVLDLMDRPHVEAQTATWDPETLAAELKEYGAWEDEEELADHEVNIKRMVWLACGDVAERPDEYEVIP